MDKVFAVETGFAGRYAVIDLPATDYEILDMLDKLRAAPENLIRWEICDYGCTGDMGIDEGSLYELNALARLLSTCDERGWAAFEGLAEMERAKTGFVPPVNRLIDLAGSTDCCHVIGNVHNDQELGKFYVDNGFLPEYEGLSESVYDNLDYGRIGKEMRKAEGGVFIFGGYVTQHTELNEMAKDRDFRPKASDYTVLIEVSVMDSGKTAMLGLPAAESEGTEVLREIGADSWDEVTIRCTDCRVPPLRDAITQENSILAANSAAAELETLSDVEVTRFKMLLEARDFSTLDEALELLREMPDYVFSPQIAEPEDVARDELQNMLSPGDAETLIPYVDLYAYGRELIEQQNIALTAYGAVERLDGQLIERMEEGRESFTMGGMTM